MQTTNDMPVVDPLGFDTFGLVPFQINPHYTDKQIEGHGGETREERIIEYLAANPKMRVVGLREGCMLKISGEHVEYIGKQSLRLFINGRQPIEIEPVRRRVLAGTPYVGWSAGANVACPTMQTTNDMPVVDPLGFDTFGLVPFQINPQIGRAHV